jgi:hypothetical protein
MAKRKINVVLSLSANKGMLLKTVRRRKRKSKRKARRKVRRRHRKSKK